MSWPALKWALLKRLPAPQKSTLITLARRQPDDLRAFPCNTDALKDEAGLSRSGVKLATAALESKKLVVVSRSKKLPPVYHLCLQSTGHDVTGYDVTGHEVIPERSRGDQSSGHDVTTNKQQDKQVKTNTSSRSREKVTDERFGQFVEDLSSHWKRVNPQLPFDFSDKDGSALKNLLKSKKALTRPVFQECLRNRCRSDEVNHTEDLHTWLPHVMKYAGGPLNKYQKPKGGNDDKRPGNPGTNGTATKADATTANARAAFDRIVGRAGPLG